VAAGGGRPTARVNGRDHDNSRATSPQNPSGSDSARAFIARHASIPLTWTASFAGGTARSFARTLSISGPFAIAASYGGALRPPSPHARSVVGQFACPAACGARDGGARAAFSSSGGLH